MTEERASVEARLERIEDLEAIRRLLHDYRRFLDGKDFASYAALFASDGEFVTHTGSAKGPEEIHNFVTALVGNGLAPRRGDDVHLVVNEVIDLDGDHATAEVTWAYLVREAEGGPALEKLGRYDDVLVREDGRWKFQRRTVGRLLRD